MKLVEFLEAVVPPGFLVAARKIEGEGYVYFQHDVKESHQEFARALVAFATAKTPKGKRSDTYFALAAYKQGFHTKEVKGKEKMVVRVRENVDTLKALWFDIDFKDGYSTPHEVGLALRQFCKASGIASPSILTHSGNGVHAYWPLTEPVALDRWLGLANGLKEAAKQHGLHADLVCTGDPCRVLRPPGTVNWKDPDNPKRVKVLYSSDKLFYDVNHLENMLSPYLKSSSSTVSGTVYDEFTGGLGSGIKQNPAHFQEIIKHCAVSKHIATTHGGEASEPEWMLTLQLLKHCEDGELWVHPVSDGHSGYTAEATNDKWQQRQENTAGPTLCTTFEGYYPELCRKCPHKGFIKTPLQVGSGDTKELGGMPWGWRCKDGNTERLMVNSETGQREWIKFISHEFTNFRTSRSRSSEQVEHLIDVPGVIMNLTIPGECLGNQFKLVEHMALYGVAFKGKEANAFRDLMTTWLKALQTAKHVAEVSEQLGWVIKDEKVIGFSCGPTTFYADGRVRNDVRSAKEFHAVAIHYKPVGSLEKWKEVAAFLAQQDNPAFTALVASAFAAPIFKFTGVTGGILSIVSAESGVGKTSALKCSQAVWGSPTHGINAIDDTPKSVARKLGFLNNLPAYWDELRGMSTIEDFLTLAFQVTQGKEKTRLDQTATLKEIHTWETMLIVASNDSIFDAMGRFSEGSDAGIARTFEITVEPFLSDSSRAEVAILFEHLHLNYGHAGKVYAQYIATHADEVRARVQKLRIKLEKTQDERGAERFWFAIMASLVVGAQLAKELQLIDINVKTLMSYLLKTLTELRGRGVESMTASEPGEILATYIQQHQDKVLIVDLFPTKRQNTRSYHPQIISSPRSDRIICHMARDDKLIRFSYTDFVRWLTSRGMPVHSTLHKFKVILGSSECKVLLGIGTKYEIPSRQRVIEVPITNSTAMVEEILDE